MVESGISSTSAQYHQQHASTVNNFQGNQPPRHLSVCARPWLNICVLDPVVTVGLCLLAGGFIAMLSTLNGD